MQLYCLDPKLFSPDKNVLSRPLRVDNSCFVGESSWMKTGLQLLRDLAPFSRDYLIPAPEKILRMSSYGVEVRDWLCGSESCHVTAQIESQNHFSSSGYVFLDTSQWSFVSSELLCCIGIFPRKSVIVWGAGRPSREVIGMPELPD